MARRKTAAYVRAPRATDPVLLGRYELVLKVLTGQLSVSAAARQAGLSRNRFQSLMHRAQAQLLEGLATKPPGRPAKSKDLRRLEHRNSQLEKRTERLEHQITRQEHVLKAASALIKDRASPTQYTPRRSRRTRTKPSATDEEDATRLFAHAQQLRQMGLCGVLVAALTGRGTATLRRWAQRARAGRPLTLRRGPPLAVPESVAAGRVAELVRESKGLMGAAALARVLPGVSRRCAARAKAETLTALERARKADCPSVHVEAPGLVRGFDGLSLTLPWGKRWVLCGGDAAVPFRTALELVEHYDALAVEQVLDEDFSLHGAPLVLRLDRAKAHSAPRVREVCVRHGVLVLHGPPRHPRYYGQLERQNREHRAWLERAKCHDDRDVVSELAQMRVMLNSVWPRRSLVPVCNLMGP